MASGTWQEDDLGRISEPYLSRWAPSDRHLRRGNPVYRELMDVGRVDARLPDGHRVTLMHLHTLAGLHIYSLYEPGHAQPVSGYAGLILRRERVCEWTRTMTLAGSAASPSAKTHEET